MLELRDGVNAAEAPDNRDQRDGAGPMEAEAEPP
jgi:hypothetical protein